MVIAEVHDDDMYTEIVYLDDPLEDVVQRDEASEEEEEAEEFYCSTCDINITSVEEHIEQFHYGEKIVVEVIFSTHVLGTQASFYYTAGSTITDTTRVCQTRTIDRHNR